ncbi:hypothetical protein CBX57_004195 [Salmonella enterica]|nr:hypothetical protein [Salmonella enterica]
MDTQSSIEKLITLGLTEYKAERLVKFAKEENMSLQKAYYETYCGIFRVDAILLSIFLFFLINILIDEDRDGLFVLFFIILLVICMEFFYRFHKGCWKRFKIYRGLKGL